MTARCTPWCAPSAGWFWPRSSPSPAAEGGVPRAPSPVEPDARPARVAVAGSLEPAGAADVPVPAGAGPVAIGFRPDVLSEYATSADAGHVFHSASEGVTLKASAPVAVSPKDSVEIEGVTVTVVIENARPTFVSQAAFEYRFEVYEGEGGPGRRLGDGVAGQGVGTTRHTFTRELAQGRTHRWRARAELEGFTGPWSDWAVFRTPVLKVLDPPVLEHPINGETVYNIREPLYVTNGTIGNTVGQVVYEFEVDDDAAFRSPIRTEARRTGGRPEAGGRTIGYIQQNLAPNTLYRWRVRARDDVDRGAWSGVQTFRTSDLR